MSRPGMVFLRERAPGDVDGYSGVHVEVGEGSVTLHQPLSFSLFVVDWTDPAFHRNSIKWAKAQELILPLELVERIEIGWRLKHPDELEDDE